MELPKNIKQPRTWIFDLDGTIVVHNGHKNGGDSLLPGVKDFFQELPEEDKVIIVTAREDEFKDATKKFLKSSGIRFNYFISGLPKGIRVLINDKKPDGEKTAFSFNLNRNEGLQSSSIQDIDPKE